MKRETKIPDASIERISLYSRPLEDLFNTGIRVISSEKLAELCKVNPAQVRKDLSYFGEFGVRGIGYAVKDLLSEIRKIIVSDREWKLAIVGLGNLGMALIRHDNFLKRGYRFVAAFDSSPRKIGEMIRSDLVVQPPSKIHPVISELGVEIGVITTPPSQSQAVADMLIEARIRAILNFSPIQVRHSGPCLVQNVDFTVSLDNLAYHLSKEV